MFNIVLSIFNRIPNVNISSSDNIQCGGFFSLNSLQLQSSSYSTEWLVEKKPDEKFPSEFDQTVLNHSASISPGTWTNYTNPLELDMKQQWHLQKIHRYSHDAVRPQTPRYRSYRLEQVPIVKQQNSAAAGKRAAFAMNYYALAQCVSHLNWYRFVNNKVREILATLLYSITLLTPYSVSYSQCTRLAEKLNRELFRISFRIFFIRWRIFV